MKVVCCVVLFIAFVAVTLYLGRNIPAENFEAPRIVNRKVMYHPGDSIVTTLRIYSGGDTLACRYIVDKKHLREAAEFLALEMRERDLSERLRANMELRRHHILRPLGCKWGSTQEEE